MPVLNSIQRGTINIGDSLSSATATITAVDVTKSELRFLGGSKYTSTGIEFIPRLTLTNSTTISANGLLSSGITTVSWELTEWL